MQLLIDSMQAMLDIAFARDPTASVAAAVGLTLLAFGLLYLGMAGGMAWWVARQPAQWIDQRALRSGQVAEEIRGSLRTILMFGLLSALTFSLLRGGWLEVRGNISWGAWALEVAALFIWNELHFYLVHRSLHWPPLFRRIHRVHHRSVRVTPWSAYHFHALEALLLGSVMPLALLFHAFSVWSLLLLPPLSLAWNVLGHANWVPRSRYAAWLANASRRHAAHHARSKGNYGFALPWLDRWLGTADAKSVQRMRCPADAK